MRLKPDASRSPCGWNLVRALVGKDAMPESFWHAMKHLNKIRNDLAHQLKPEDIDKAFHEFLGGSTDRRLSPRPA